MAYFLSECAVYYRVGNPGPGCARLRSIHAGNSVLLPPLKYIGNAHDALAIIILIPKLPLALLRRYGEN